MVNPSQSLTLPPVRTYTRTDFAALRAFVQRVPPASIAKRYYDVDDVPQAAEPETMRAYLTAMRDELVRLAMMHGKPVLAEHLRASIRQYGSPKLTAVTLRMIEDAAPMAVAAPAAAHGVGLWFRPLVAKRLIDEGITTLGELVDWCNRHGGSWWRSVPRIGALRAKTLIAWLRRHEATLGCALDVDVAAVDERPLTPVPSTAIVVGGPPEAPRLAPFERLAVPEALSGGEGTHGTGQRGTNRAPTFSYLRASHDLDALHAWLHRYRDRPATHRAYQREVERFILWAVVVRGVAVSSVKVEDCEAYKDFLAAPSPAFTGPKRPRTGGRWRPFTGSLSVDSQAYAVRTLRGAFDWLTRVRYLAGNPWEGVTDPATVSRERAMQIERALPTPLWHRVRAALDAFCERSDDDAPQWRAARAAMLLMGASGLRRAEAAGATREALCEAGWRDMSQHNPQQTPTAVATLWQITIVGKRRRERTVPVSAATISALRAHWADRGLDFDAMSSAIVTVATGDGQAAGVPRTKARPLIAPLTIPDTPAALARHGDVTAHYTADSLARLVRGALRRITLYLQEMGALSLFEKAQLETTSAHALRHTFATVAVANDMPLDVVQQILGHASLQTTSIYTRAGAQRMLEAAARHYAADEPASTMLPDALKPAAATSPMQTATIRLTLAIDNACAGGRSRAHAIREIEAWLHAGFAMARLGPDAYELQVPYGDEDELDACIMTLLEDIGRKADARRCTQDARACWVGRGRVWSLDASVTAGEPATFNVIPFPLRPVPGGKDPEEGEPTGLASRIWRLRVNLADVTPAVWRQIDVPADLSFAGLHEVIQAAMGWDNAHRHEFGISGATVGDEQGMTVGVVCRPGDVLDYTYDMGDLWRHEVVIEAQITPSARARYPRCVAGRNACPPEDCGGHWGYAAMIAALARGRGAERRDYLEWLGGPFDPHAFRIGEVNQRLAAWRSERT
jgi:site-specific recombinase XerD